MAEVEEIFEQINNGRNFLLSGGAGSGKTYTLVQVIKKVIQDNPSSLVACMTYTNAAVKEIEERVNHENLNVTTIHDFLWDNIKHFQKELKACLVELANDELVTTVKVDDVNPVPDNYFNDFQDPNNKENQIQYKEYLRISKGIISHDQVIAVSERMFERCPRLGDIVKDKYKFIFIDEYQDTQREVVKIFLEHFKLTAKRNVIGFFGDAMQSIYDNNTVGNLDDYKGEGEQDVREVKKEQNRRNPSLVIELANKLRTDGLVQIPSEDIHAPNMMNGAVKIGDIKFLYSDEENIDEVKALLGWEFENSKETKELNLTHNLIADKANIRTLMDIYDKDQILKYRDKIKRYLKQNPVDWDLTNLTFGEVVDRLVEVNGPIRDLQPTRGRMTEFIDNNQELYLKARDTNYYEFARIYIDKDQLLDDKKQDEDDVNNKGSKRDDLIKHLYRLQEIIWLYQYGHYNEFLQVTDYRKQLNSVNKKKILKEKIENLANVGNKTIGEVIEEAHENDICIKGDTLVRFADEKKYIYDQVAEVQFKEFQFLYEYLEGRTPFSTQHKTKGTEFDNVLVILDNGGWTQYNFKNLFLEQGTESVLNRTRKLFYVCCTRAKERLAVYYHAPDLGVINKAKEWFGEENVIQLN